MPWKDKTVEEIRKEFAEAAKGSENMSALCREFGITRATGYKWLERYIRGESLSDQSRRPQTTANKTPDVANGFQGRIPDAKRKLLLSA